MIEKRQCPSCSAPYTIYEPIGHVKPGSQDYCPGCMTRYYEVHLVYEPEKARAFFEERARHEAANREIAKHYGGKL
jgi:hypothetical protein